MTTLGPFDIRDSCAWRERDNSPRICDIAVQGLPEEFTFQELPYLGFLDRVLVSLVALASKPDKTWQPFQVDDYPTVFACALDGATLVFAKRGEEVLFEGSFGDLFIAAAREFRREASRIEQGNPNYEAGITVMFSDKRGW